MLDKKRKIVDVNPIIPKKERIFKPMQKFEQFYRCSV